LFACLLACLLACLFVCSGEVLTDSLEMDVLVNELRNKILSRMEGFGNKHRVRQSIISFVMTTHVVVDVVVVDDDDDDDDDNDDNIVIVVPDFMSHFLRN
jgi:hypothetical protein